MKQNKKKGKGAVIVMAYTACAAYISDNITKDCAAPLAGGYTGRGFLVAVKDIKALTYDVNNSRIVTAITLKTGAKVAVIDNVFSPTPLTGSNTQSNTDDGMMKFRKNITVSVPRRGAGASEEIVEPTFQAPLGYVACLEKKDRSGDGSFELIGLEQGLLATADGIVRDEYANGGCTMITMSCNETIFEYSFYDTDYDTTLTAFETILSTSAF